MLDAGFLVQQLLNGLVYGLLLVLIASGLALIFGMMGVVNFAHGTLYTIGAYVGLTVAQDTGNFWLAIIVACALVALLGAGIERFTVRPIRKRPQVYSLLLTFGFAMALEQLVRLIFGPYPKSMNPPSYISGSVKILGTGYPTYRLFIIVFAIVVAVALLLFLERTRLGLIIRAATSDGEMVDLLGINILALFTGVFAIGAGLAALGGIVAVPLLSAQPSMGLDVIIDAFVVLIIGGLGSFRGAILAGLIIGQVETWGVAFVPEYAMVILFVVMAAVLLWRPAGILGEGRFG